MGRSGNVSSSSSIDSSSSHPIQSAASSASSPRMYLNTDLRLGLGFPTPQPQGSSISRVQHSNWPPIKALLRSMLTSNGHRCHRTFFVKVNMEGVPIGRKLDLFVINGYNDLIKTLERMFSTIIFCPHFAEVYTNEMHVLIYEDKEGDWMMVGDVPWQMFLTTIKRLKICRAKQ